jgi:sugar phosphate isomerase/epimerase
MPGTFIRDFGMDTITLAGPLAAKLRAIRGAGFDQVMLAARDLVGHPDGWRAAVAEVHASGLRVTGFQVLRDFEGLSGHLHDYKVDIARSMIEMCEALRSPLLLACSSTSRHATADEEAIARDLRKLAMMALPRGIRVAYEGLSWGRHVNDLVGAWRLVQRADVPNLADFMWQEIRTVEERIDTARHFRVFPGEGVHSDELRDLVLALDAKGYRGDYSFEVFNDDYTQLPLEVVAERARRSATWLAEDVLRRARPLPGARSPLRAACRCGSRCATRAPGGGCARWPWWWWPMR